MCYLFKSYLTLLFLYSVLFKTVNVAKGLEMLWSQPAGMLCKPEKLLASLLEAHFPVQRQLCPHGSLPSPVPLLRVSLSLGRGSPEHGASKLRYFPRFKCSLSVHCSQTAPLHWPQFHSRRPVCRTVYMMVPLCFNECHRMLEK